MGEPISYIKIRYRQISMSGISVVKVDNSGIVTDISFTSVGEWILNNVLSVVMSDSVMGGV